MNSLHDHYYLTTAVQACTLVSTGDVFAQLIELRAAQKKEGASQLALEDYDPTRTVRMGCLGLFIGGAAFSWLYVKYRSIWIPYITHAMCDVVVFAVGYVLLFL